jgi:hypothetical protein
MDLTNLNRIAKKKNFHAIIEEGKIFVDQAFPAELDSLFNSK